MKFNSLMVLATLSFSTVAMAQVPLNPSNLSGQVGKPASIDTGAAAEVLGFILRRLHTIDFTQMMQEMDNKGLSDMKMEAAFTVSGALVYNHELEAERLSSWDETGRNAGIQLVPYTIKKDTSGNMYIAINPVSFKNMNALECSNQSLDADFFSVVDNLDFLVFKWDRGMSFQDVKTFDLKIVNADAKLDLLDSAKKTRYLAITGGGTFGVGRREFTLENGEKIQIGNMESSTGLSAGIEGRYGLEYNEGLGKKGNLNLKATMIHGSQNGYYMDSVKVKANEDSYAEAMNKYDTKYNSFQTNIVQWNNDKADYEKANTNGKPISDESFAVISSRPKPTSPSKPEKKDVERDQALTKYSYLSPSLEVSRALNKEGSHPIKATFGVSMNIPISHTTTGPRIFKDYSTANRNLVNATVKINF